MKQIKATLRADGRWEAKGMNPISGQRKSFYGKSQLEAESKAMESMTLKDDKTLYGFYANQYLPGVSGKSQGWLDQIAYAMDKFILPTFGKMELDEIKKSAVLMAFNRWSMVKKEDGSARYKKVTLQKVRIVFACVMNLAVDLDLIVKNPVSRVAVHGEESRPKKALSSEELWRLYQASDSLSRPVILLAGFCGLRIGECCGVQFNAINQDNVLEVNQQVTQYDGGCKVTKTLKTPQSYRFIPLPDELKEELIGAGQVSNVFVCSDTKGGFITPNNATRSLQAACKRAGIENVSPHILRHTFISLLENDIEAPMRIVEELAGKAKQGNTANYSHTRLEQKRKWMLELWKHVSTAGESNQKGELRVSVV